MSKHIAIIAILLEYIYRTEQPIEMNLTSTLVSMFELFFFFFLNMDYFEWIIKQLLNSRIWRIMQISICIIRHTLQKPNSLIAK